MPKRHSSKALLMPNKIDNTYRGIPLAKYCFYLITAITIIRSCIHILAPDGGAESIATIPLGSYSAEAAATAIYLFAVWGLSQLIIGLMYLVVLWRYKSLIPLMYVTVFIEYTARIIIGALKPVALSGVAPGGVANYIMAPLSLVMLYISQKEKILE